MNYKTFFDGYRTEFRESLKQSQVDGLMFLLEKFQDDEVPLNLMAYYLATIKHEADNKYQPIEEYGKGKKYKYGKPDPITGHTYYGRGYVQITWKSNYEAMGRLLKLDLVNNPALALDKDIAYELLTLGMTRGMYGRKVTTYINDEKTDFIGARRSVNGTDQAKLIANYADKFLKILKQATND
jgi:putative chitinase